MSLYPSYARPSSLKEASELLAGLSSGGVVIAGGQELMPSINYGVLQPSVYVDIGGLRELRGIRLDGEMLSIGALTVHRELQTDALVTAQVPLLAYAATRAGGGRQVHNRGTIGGNIVAQHPLYDIAPSLLALEAQVEVIKGGSVQTLALADVLKDTSLALGSEAILTRVLVAPISPGTGWAYEKLKLSGGAYGSANAAALVTLAGGTLASVRLVLGAVADRLIDASAALAGCIGKPWSDGLGAEIERLASALVQTPLSDQQGDGAWRQAMAGVVARRAVAAAVARVQG